MENKMAITTTCQVSHIGTRLMQLMSVHLTLSHQWLEISCIHEQSCSLVYNSFHYTSIILSHLNFTSAVKLTQNCYHEMHFPGVTSYNATEMSWWLVLCPGLRWGNLQLSRRLYRGEKGREKGKGKRTVRQGRQRELESQALQFCHLENTEYVLRYADIIHFRIAV